MESKRSSLLEQFPTIPAWGTREHHVWRSLYTTAFRLHEVILGASLRRRRISEWEANTLKCDLGHPWHPGYDTIPWEVKVRAVERLRELNQLAEADRDLHMLTRDVR